MKKAIFILLFSSVYCVLLAQQKQILFVGNSYISSNNLPAVTNSIAESTGNGFMYDSHTPGGNRFLHHASNNILAAKINSKDWDYVVLQGQSVEVALTGSIFNNSVQPYAEQLCDKIRQNNSCSQPVFFRTWGRENGLSDCSDYPWTCSYFGMDNALAQNYQTLANENDAFISPVGAVWRHIKNNYPNLELYSSDGSHPSKTGTYVAALTFYTVFFRNDPTLVTYNDVLTPGQAQIVKNVVRTIVFEDLERWNVGIYDPKPSFEFQVDEGVVTFNNTSENAEAFTWDFGDGNYSNDQNPTHIYSEGGEYSITLTTEKCGISKSFNTTVDLTALSINDRKEQTIEFYPNPSTGIVRIKGKESIFSIQVYNILGQKLLLQKKNFESLDLSEFTLGNYLLKITDKLGGISYEKILLRR